MTATDHPADLLGKGASRRLADHLSSLTYEALPPAVVELTKKCVLDAVGVTLGATGLVREAETVFDYVAGLEGKPAAFIWGSGRRAPAPWAAFVNGASGHMLDYDDEARATHPSITTVPVAFAISEQLGGVSGQDMICAIAAGIDLIIRLSASVTIPEWTNTEGWFGTQLLGFLSAAATAGILLRLDTDQMENALGIAFNQLSGSRQMAVGAATDMRALQAGFADQGGVVAAEFARRGMTGDREFLEGRYGLFRTYIRCEPDWQVLIGDLGRRWIALEDHSFKVWPACAATRAPNAAILELRQEHGLQPEEVASIQIVGGDQYTRLLSEPLDSKRRPRSSIDGKYSIPFTAAIMMSKGNVTIRSYTDEGLNDPEVLAMAERVVYRAASGGDKRSAIPGVEVHTRDGRVLSRTAEGVPGDPRNPVSWSHLEAKFRDCASFARGPLSPDKQERLIAGVRDLEHLADVSELSAVMGEGYEMTSAPDRVVLLGCGDVGPVHEPMDAYSRLIRPVLADADIRVAQCERVYSDRGSLQVHSGGAHSRVSPHFASVFTDCGFDVVSVASNHAMDWGEEAMLDAIANLEERGLRTVGAGRNLEEARQPVFIEKKGVRTAFLAYCSVLREGYAAGPSTAGVAPMRAHTYYEPLEYQPGTPPKVVTIPYEEDLEGMVTDIRKAKADAQVVVLILHWGIHFIPKMLADYQATVAAAAFSAGADLILGHHAHVPKGVGVYDGKVCFFSLSNFIMSAPESSPARLGRFMKQYGVQMDADYPRLPYGQDAKRTLIARAELSRRGVERVSFLPAEIDRQLRPEVLRETDTRFAEAVRYMEWASDELPHRFTVEGSEVVVG